MGWTGCYMDECPKGKDRIRAAIWQEGYEAVDGGREWTVLASAISGTTVYLAVRYTNPEKALNVVYGVVILTAFEDGEFLTKAMTEEMMPYCYDCPKRVLDLLSPTDNENALEWRRLCEEKRKAKSRDALGRLPLGAKIRITGDGIYKGRVLESYLKGSRKVFVDWASRRCMTPKMVRSLGYEVVVA